MKNISGQILTEIRWDDSFHVPEANAENTTLIEEVRPNGWERILDVCGMSQSSWMNASLIN